MRPYTSTRGQCSEYRALVPLMDDFLFLVTYKWTCWDADDFLFLISCRRTSLRKARSQTVPDIKHHPAPILFFAVKPHRVPRHQEIYYRRSSVPILSMDPNHSR